MSKKKELITPLHDRVVIEPQEAKKVTEGGIFRSDMGMAAKGYKSKRQYYIQQNK